MPTLPLLQLLFRLVAAHFAPPVAAAAAGPPAAASPSPHPHTARLQQCLAVALPLVIRRLVLAASSPTFGVPPAAPTSPRNPAPLGQSALGVEPPSGRPPEWAALVAGVVTLVRTVGEAPARGEGAAMGVCHGDGECKAGYDR